MLNNIFNKYIQSFRKNDFIFLDGAATSILSTQDIKYVQKTYNQPLTAYRTLYSEKNNYIINAIKREILEYLKLNNEYNIFFGQNATDCSNKLALSLVFKKKILCYKYDHHSNLVPWINLTQRLNIECKFFTDYDHLNQLWDNSVGIVTFPYFSNIGLKQITSENITTLIKMNNFRKNTYIFCDISQCRLLQKIDVQNYDFLFFSSHKMYSIGGLGIGIVSNRLTTKLQNIFGGGGNIYNIDTNYIIQYKELPEALNIGTPNCYAIYFLRHVLKKINHFSDLITKRMKKLIQYFKKQYLKLNDKDLVLISDIDNTSGIFLFYHKKIHAHDIENIFYKNKIYIRSGQHCASLFFNTLAEIQNTMAVTAFRITISFFNKKTDIDKVFNILSKIDNYDNLIF